MTDFSKISRGQPRTAPNIKGGGRRRARSLGNEYERTGFKLVGPPAIYNYPTWAGIIFRVAPGTITDEQGHRAGMIARCDSPKIEVWFRYGTRPQVIKDRLDDEILRIMRHDANIDAPVEFEPGDDWIDMDAWMMA
jgi:hypothetical protein